MKKPIPVEKRYPTRRARELADEAIDALPETDAMTTYIDVWIATYHATGGLEKKS